MKNLLLYLALLLLAACAPRQHLDLTAGQHGESLNARQALSMNREFLLYVPEGYGRKHQEWPLVIFLHGSGERGRDINKVKKLGPPKLAEGNPGWPFLVASPQALDSTFWSPVQLKIFLDILVRNLKVDRGRIYLTGLSMGGAGTWQFAAAYPGRFAAIAPVCGRTDTTTACCLRGTPVWAFHGAVDDVVPVTESEEMVGAVNRRGGDAKLTIYPELAHNAWDSAYVNAELFPWLLRHSLRYK